jgi:hypothetical protein
MFNLFKKKKPIQFEPIQFEPKKPYVHKKPEFIVETRGLLHIVYEVYEHCFDVNYFEESRWEDLEKAKKHCELLNNQ